jgi:hypothetical protein
MAQRPATIAEFLRSRRRARYNFHLVMGISFDPNWARISRWCSLGAIVMVLWLLAPTVKCSFAAFRDEPLEERTPHSDGSERVAERGFLSRWGSAIKGCYAVTPLLGQEAWKRKALYGLAGLAALTYAIAAFERRRKRTHV